MSIASPAGRLASLPLSLLMALGCASLVHAACDPATPLGFSNTTFPATASFPHGLSVGDINQDGHLDVVLASIGINGDSGAVAIYRGNGDGSFTVQRLRPSLKPYDVILADLNNDSRLDIVTADGGGGTVTTLLGNGTGGFTRMNSYSMGGVPFMLAVADFDLDGYIDVAISLNAASSVVVMRGNGDGTLGSVLATIPSGIHPAGVCAADLDGDGKTDLAISSYDALKVLVAMGNGNGTFQPTSAFTVQSNPWSIIAHDEDQDGHADLIVSTFTGIDLLRGAAGGGFLPRSSLITGVSTAGIAIADFNRDGISDLAAAYPTSEKLAVLYGQPSTTPPYRPAQSLEDRRYPIAVATGDFDEDGIVDVVAADYSGPDLALFRGACIPPALPTTPLDLVWGAMGRAIAAETGVQSGPVACADDAGGAFVAWIDSRAGTDADLYATHFDVNGQTAGGWTPGGDPVCVSVTSPLSLALVPDGQGGAMVVWDDTRSGVRQTYAMHMFPTQPADPAWRPGGTHVTTDSLTAETLVGACPDFQGGTYVAWQTGTFSYRLGHLETTGLPSPAWGPKGIPLGGADPTGSFFVGGLAPDDTHGIWVGAGSNTQFCIPDAGCLYFHSATVAHNSIACVGLPGAFFENKYPPAIIQPDGSGGVIASYDFGGLLSRIGSDGAVKWSTGGSLWASATDGAGGTFVLQRRTDVLPAVRYSSAGIIESGWQPNGVDLRNGIGDGDTPAMLSDGMRGFVAAWRDSRDGTFQLYGQHMGPDGGIPTGATNGVLLCSAPGARLSPVLVPSIGPSAFEIWQDTRSDGGDIYAQRIAWDAAVPVAYSLVSASARFDRVDLAWYSIDAPAIATVERSQTGEQWQPIGQANPGGNGLLAFVDRAVAPGIRYGYRLRLADGTTHGETWVDVPIAQLSLLATPNPSSGPLQISFGLSNAHSAQLEFFDISGRRVVSHEVGSFGAGSHVFDLKTRLSAGVYLVRLEQDGRALTRRVLVVR